MSDKLTNLAIFQLVWFASVLAGGTSWHWLGTLLIAAAVAWQLRRADYPGREMRLVLLAVCVGLVWDSLLVTLGLTRYEYGQVLPGLAPHWIIALWALFATTLNLSMRWLRKSLWLAALFGAVGGPLAYLAGSKLGSVSFASTESAMLALALGWALFTTLMVFMAGRLDGFAYRDSLSS